MTTAERRYYSSYYNDAYIDGETKGIVKGRTEGREEERRKNILAFADLLPPEELARRFNVHVNYVLDILDRNMLSHSEN